MIRFLPQSSTSEHHCKFSTHEPLGDMVDLTYDSGQRETLCERCIECLELRKVIPQFSNGCFLPLHSALLHIIL